VLWPSPWADRNCKGGLRKGGGKEGRTACVGQKKKKKKKKIKLMGLGLKNMVFRNLERRR